MGMEQRGEVSVGRGRIKGRMGMRSNIYHFFNGMVGHFCRVGFLWCWCTVNLVGERQMMRHATALLIALAVQNLIYR